MTSLRSAPAHQRLLDDLRHGIVAGRLGPGDRLAGEVALAGQYAISVTSVRRGLAVLEREGLLVRRQGSGTYVNSQPVPSGAPAGRPLARDAVALVLPMRTLSYHPYFSEQMAGLRAGLGQRGWALWEPGVEAMEASAGQDFSRVPLEHLQLWRELAAHAGLAGLVTRISCLPPPEHAWQPGFPIVVLEPNLRYPFVGYDWGEEIERGARVLLQGGCARLWCLGMFPEATFRGAVTRAAGALGVAEPTLIVRRTTNWIRTISESIQHAFEAAVADLAAGSAAADALLVTSDYEAQGVVDALVKLGRRVPDDFRLVALTNEKSRLHAPWPFTCLVADGYAFGQAIADLVHQQIVTPAQAPRQVVLSGRLVVR